MSAFSDDDAAELKASLQRARRQPMNFAAALGKRPEDHRLSLHPTRAGRALAKVLKEATGSKQLAFGITEVDDSRKDTLVLVLDAKPPTGLAKKLANWLKLHGLPIRKVALKLEGQELEDDGDEQESEDASPNTAAPGKLTTLEAAFRQLVLKVKTLVEQTPNSMRPCSLRSRPSSARFRRATKPPPPKASGAWPRPSPRPRRAWLLPMPSTSRPSLTWRSRCANPWSACATCSLTPR